MMLFGNNKPDRLRRLLAQNAHAAHIAGTIVARADDMGGAAPIEHRIDPARGILLETSRLLGERVVTLGVAWAVTGHTAFRRRIVSEIMAAARFPDWNRQHFIDTAEMAAAVAIGRNWAQPVMSKNELALVEDALLRHALLPGLSSLHAGSDWTTARTNWTLVCCGGLITAAALTRSAMPEPCDELLDLALGPFRSALSIFDDKGGWPEGAAYGAYAARYAILAVEALTEAGLSHRVPEEVSRLPAHWRFQRALVSPSGQGFNAGDEPTEHERSPMLGWFAARSEEEGAVAWQWQAPGAVHPFDLLWYHAPPDPPTFEAAPRIEVFDAGYAILRHHADGREWYLAARAGRNTTNHCHADLGSFVLDVGRNRLVCDLGREDYAAPGYFDPAHRPSYFLTQTRAHNVAFAGEQSREAEATIVADGSRIALDIVDPASPFRHLRGFTPSENGVVVVADLIVPKHESDRLPVLWQCHTQAAASDGDGRICLGDGDLAITARLYAPDEHPLTIEPIAADEDRFSQIRRLTARLAVPADGLFVACLFSDRQGEPDQQSVEAWLREIASVRWPKQTEEA
ncbi:heparinase II/III family protein [Sinorhizobium sp. RAC02]|uniref:heparinase II/III domain-containing protein n=1 Tax=Sinorhizobium sp. RAC02 TaxID=1842534 RepID=UPI00083DA3C7|nr:heparinase II/III family protein [Sinorhizobium sp. RAC02]AOF89993.1 heparinase II/III-like family protein [Sinorhizobium sp. RAC02]